MPVNTCVSLSHVCGIESRGTAQIKSRDVERYDDPQTLHNVNIVTGCVCEKVTEQT